MKYFLDCEFIERGHGHPIDLISIGIVAENGREYYAINQNFTPKLANDWVVENVLSNLPPMNAGVDATAIKLSCDYRWEPEVIPGYAPLNYPWKSPLLISKEIRSFCEFDSQPEFWGEWCSYDWVALCQLFGTMMDLPRGWPMRCRDVVQVLEDELKLSQDDWPESLETEGNHNALLGAKTVKVRWEWCEQEREDQRQDLITYGYEVIK